MPAVDVAFGELEFVAVGELAGVVCAVSLPHAQSSETTAVRKKNLIEVFIGLHTSAIAKALTFFFLEIVSLPSHKAIEL
uniref:hypothetical protein n=1 Tax=Hassallia byssoidea TaxID=482630 RepID=UPI001F1D7EDD|nr:hypothetical protein [Hassalia byssoidea]